ncbi:MAG: hypothetical protein ACLP4R_00900 [Solirubrobacteraceae bacterium]
MVRSPHGDIPLTAAHCIEGDGEGYVFARDLHDEISSYGRWT